jgi:hypothetical protein
MLNRPSEEELNRLPKLYQTSDVTIKDKIIHQHYFMGANDWYMAEYCPHNRDFYGYTVRNNDHRSADWGYTSLNELAHMNIRGTQVDRDLHWEPRRFWSIPGIHKGYQYKWDRIDW